MRKPRRLARAAVSALRNLAGALPSDQPGLHSKKARPQMGDGPAVQRLSCLSGPFLGHGDPSSAAIHNTTPATGLAIDSPQLKVRGVDLAGIRVPCWGTPSGRRDHHRCASATFSGRPENLLPAPRGAPGWEGWRCAFSPAASCIPRGKRTRSLPRLVTRADPRWADQRRTPSSSYANTVKASARSCCIARYLFSDRSSSRDRCAS